MACPLTQGFTLDCDDNVGGIEKIWITEFSNVSSTTVAADEITALTQKTGTNFHVYELKKEVGDFVTTENHSDENGTTFYETVLNFTIKKLSNTKNTELRLLALNRLYIIVLDNNGVYSAIGHDFGAEKMGGTNQSASGKAFGDMNGYTLGFTDKSKKYPLTVEASVVTGLSTS